jgi:hypothetical protein
MSMDSQFATYNTHLYAFNQYWDKDPHLFALKMQPYVYQNPLVQNLPTTIPGIYPFQMNLRDFANSSDPKSWGFPKGELHNSPLGGQREFTSR